MVDKFVRFCGRWSWKHLGADGATWDVGGGVLVVTSSLTDCNVTPVPGEGGIETWQNVWVRRFVVKMVDPASLTMFNIAPEKETF